MILKWNPEDQIIARYSFAELATESQGMMSSPTIPYQVATFEAGVLGIKRPEAEIKEGEGPEHLFFFSRICVVTKDPANRKLNGPVITPDQIDSFYKTSLEQYPNCSLTDVLPGDSCHILSTKWGHVTRAGKELLARLTALPETEGQLIAPWRFPNQLVLTGLVDFQGSWTGTYKDEADKKVKFDGEIQRLYGPQFLEQAHGRRVLPKRLTEACTPAG